MTDEVQRGSTVDDADLLGALHRQGLQRAVPDATWPRARPACRSPSTCPPRPATTPTTRWPAARSARSACRSPTSATWRTLLDQIPVGEMNTSMTINATAAWLLGLYVANAERQGVESQAAAGHDPERHREGVPAAGAPTSIPPLPSRRLIVDMFAFCQECDPAVEPDERVQLPPAGGRGDAGAGARLRAGHRHRRARRGAGSRARSPRTACRRCSRRSASS